MKTRIARLWSERLLAGGAAKKFTSPPPTSFLRSVFTSAQPVAWPRLQKKSVEQSALLCLRYQRSALARRLRSVRFKSNRSNHQHVNPTPHLGSPDPAPSISQRLKQLSREYGWAALGVYLGLSLIDFPLCFLAVRLLGTDRIGHYEDMVKHAFWSVVRVAFPDAGKKSAEAIAADKAAEATAREGDFGIDGVAVQHNGGADACMNPSPN